MQKKLIALALASLSSAAFADATNVTIYGVADATFDVIRISDNATNTPNFNRVSTNGSHIGFRGTENLGNGLSAIFQFESEANFDQNSSLALNRDSFVGLTGGFGKIMLGTLTGPSNAFAASLDVNTGDNISSNTAILGKLGGTNAANGFRSISSGSSWDTRFQNAVAYVSPSFSGLQATGLYVANETKDENPGFEVKPSLFDLGLTYTNGPIMVGTTYARQRDSGVADEKDTEFRIGGMYDFGMASVRALYGRTKFETAGYEAKQNTWGIGGTYNVTANGKLVSQYYVARDVKENGVDLNETGAALFTIGYEHNLSKRTMLKAGYARVANDDNTNGYDFGYNASGFAGNGFTSAGPALPGSGFTASGFQFGVRHAF
ncbi:MAG: porin [Rugosibacter sp.]